MLERIKPVSYTHLDVYKRQVEDSVRIIEELKNSCVCCGNMR